MSVKTANQKVERLISTREAASLLSVNERWVRDALRYGRYGLKPVRLGRLVRVRASDIDAIQRGVVEEMAGGR